MENAEEIDILSYYLDENLKQNIFLILAYQNESGAFYNLSETSKNYYSTSKTIKITYSIFELNLTTKIKPYFQCKILWNRYHKTMNNLSVLFENCSRKGYLQLLKILQQNYNFTQINLNCTFRIACVTGHLKIVKFMIENGAEIDCDNCQPLYNSVHGSHVEVTKYLISKKVKIANHVLSISKDSKNKEIRNMLEIALKEQNQGS